MDQKRLLELRTKAKKKKPLFVLKGAHFTPRIKKRWRFPRGLHSAHRQGYRGKPALAKPGYGSPAAVRGLHSSGLARVVVASVSQLKALDPKTQGAVISSTVGMRKRKEILLAARESKIKVLNVRDLSAAVAAITETVTARQKEKVSKKSAKTKKEEERKKKMEEKMKKEDEQKKSEATHEPGVEEKLTGKEELRREQEKTLTKRD